MIKLGMNTLAFGIMLLSVDVMFGAVPAARTAVLRPIPTGSS